MRKVIFTLALIGVTTGVFAQNKKKEVVMEKNKGVYVVNTTSLCNTVGYVGTTPLKVTIKKDKIEKIEALQNQETPRYFARIQKVMFPKYAGLAIKDIESVDGVTGATMTSDAVKANVKSACEYYKANK